MAQLVEPQEGDEICDPACGSGSLLMKCGRLIRERTGSRKYALYGQEAIGSTWALAKMNMFLHGEDNHRIEWGDTIRNPKLLDSRQPAQALRRRRRQSALQPGEVGLRSAADDKFGRFRRGLPPRTKGDYAFILHMIETMKPGTGRMAVVVPHGVLFRGAAEGKIRKKLDRGEPARRGDRPARKAVLRHWHSRRHPGLPRSKNDDNVLFIDASREYQDGKNQNLLREATSEHRRDCSGTRASTSTPTSPPDEIAENDFNLNIPRYVDTFEEEEEIDLMAVRAERRSSRPSWPGWRRRWMAT